jgi:hypothetical protein
MTARTPMLGILAWVLACSVFSPSLFANAWEQAETRHFIFIFEPGDRTSVNELLTFCEDVYARVTGVFGSYPDKVPCIIRGRRDDANGLTYSFPSRIDLYVKSPTDFALGARTESWLRVLLTHELSHFVHQSMPTGLMHGLSRLFGADLSSAGLLFLPGWAIEGPAVYDETVFSSGGRGRNPLFEMYLKAAAEEGRFFSLAQAGYPSTSPPPGRIYVAGFALIDWMQKTYGPDTLRKIMTAYLDFPFLGPWHAIAKVTGRSADDIYADVRADLQRKYGASAEVRGGTRITPDGVGSWTRPQSTAQGLYAYHTGPSSVPSIVRLDPATGEERELVRADLTDDFSFCATADGKTVWFSSLTVDFRRGAEVRTVSDLFVLDPAGTSGAAGAAVRRVTVGGHLWHPAVSADGRTLVAVQGAGPYSRLVSVDAGTGSLHVLFSRTEGNVYSPALSPDGTRVAFVFNLRGMQDVYVADVRGLERSSVPLADTNSPVNDVNADEGRVVLGPDPFGEYFPSFIDANRVLFSSDRSGSVCLYVANLATGGVAVCQKDPVAAISGTSDGRTLTYASWASTGGVLKTVPYSAGAPLPTSEVETGLPYPPPTEWAGASTLSVPYRDLPLPYLWLPNLTLVQTGPSVTDLSVGVGAMAFGESVLGASTWQIDAGWLPGAAQPSAGLSAVLDIGALQAAAWSRLGYGWSAGWTEYVQSSVALSYSLIGDTVRDSSRSLTVGLGVRHRAELAESGPFTFQDSLRAPGGAWFNTLSVPAYLRFQRQGLGSPADLFPTGAVDAWIQGTTFLPVLSLSAPREQTDLFAALSIPSPFAHQVIKLGVKAAHNAGSTSGPYQDGFTLPRGFTTGRTRSMPGGLLGSIDYFAPLGLLDLPLFLGWALTGAGVGLHVEGVADFDIGAPAFSVLPDVFAGLELTLRFTYGSFSFPLGLGIAADVNASAPSEFDPARDLRLYLFTGFDAFGGGGNAALSGNAAAVPPKT